MIKEAINVFSGGMNKDLSELNISNRESYHIENFRHVTEAGSSTGALVTVKGNKLITAIPSAPSIYKITEDSFGSAPAAPWTYTISFTNSSGIISSTVGDASISGYDVLFDYIYNELTTNSIYSSFTVVRPSNHEILVYSLSDDLISENSGNWDLFSASQSNLQIIGSTYIRDDIYLFTTNDNTQDGGIGQVWKFTYNEDTVIGNLELKYTGDLKFSKQHLIEAVGRYENSGIQRIYWTDNHSSPKVLNVADPYVLNTPLTLVSLQSGVEFEKPLFKGVSSGGSLKTGVYQVSYRLKRGGAVTQYSFPSPQINVIKGSETSAPYFKLGSTPIEYSGGAINDPTDKKLTFEVRGLDTRYEIIEFVYIYKLDNTGEPLVFSFAELAIPTDGNINIDLTGGESVSEVSFTDFSIYSALFERVKTIASKDNRLVLANITTSNYHNLSMNARAYRWKDDGFGSPTSYISDINIDPDDPLTSTTDRDAVNPYNTDETNEYKYQTDLTTLGGEGPNVSYTFVKQKLIGDDKYAHSALSQPIVAPLIDTIRYTPLTYDLGVDNQDYNYAQIWENFKHPAICSLFKGYARGEVYRFGLVLYDLFGRPGFVNWIGDIKMPESYDTDAIDADESNFLIANDDRNGNMGHWMYSLGVQFEVNIPIALQPLISGYSIVRVEREDKDKTRLGTGLLTQLNLYTNSSGDDIYAMVGNAQNDNLSEQDLYTFDCPDFYFKGTPDFKSSDYIRIISVLTAPDSATPGGPLDAYYKYYHLDDPTEAPYSISIANLKRNLDSSMFVYRGNLQNTSTGNQFWNYSVFNAIGDTGEGVGSDTCFLQLSTPIDWATDFSLGNGGGEDLQGKLLVSYERPNTSQYGGATESARSRNVYISCGHFQGLDSSYSFSQTFNVFSGDVFINFYGLTKTTQNDLLLTEAQLDPGVSPQSIGYFFPTESSLNLDLRYGYHLANKDDGTGSYPGDSATNYLTFDEIAYSYVYSAEDDVIEFIPKPFNYSFNDEFDARVWASNEKISGEQDDSWRVFPVSNYRDGDAIYGPINRLQVESESIFALQNKAVSRVLINPRATISTNVDEEVKLGTGDIVDSFQYISKVYGCRHRWANTIGNGALYFVDANSKKLVKITSEGINPLSVSKGMDSWFRSILTQQSANNDNPVTGDGIHMVYDYVNGEALTTFKITSEGKQKEYTLSYNANTDNLSPFYTFWPSIYVTDRRHLFTTSGNNIYIHGKGNICEFYGIVHDAKVILVCNDLSHLTKTFDNIKISSDSIHQTDLVKVTGDFFHNCRVYNTYQNTGYFIFNLGTNLRRKERTFQFDIPRNIVLPDQDYNIFDTNFHDSTRQFKERIRDKFVYIELTKRNEDNNRFTLYNCITRYRPSII